MSEPLVIARRARTLAIVAAAVAVLGIVGVIVTGVVAAQQISAANEHAASVSKQLAASRAATKKAENRAGSLSGSLAACAVAFYAQQEVSSELRKEANDGFTAISNNLATLGASTLDSSGIVSRIEATNDKENAIDGSPCDDYTD